MFSVPQRSRIHKYRLKKDLGTTQRESSTFSKTAFISSFLGCKGQCASQLSHSCRFASFDRLSPLDLLGSLTSSMRLCVKDACAAIFSSYGDRTTSRIDGFIPYTSCNSPLRKKPQWFACMPLPLLEPVCFASGAPELKIC